MAMLILVGGYKNSGKDTASWMAKEIIEKSEWSLGSRAKRISLADPLKEMYSEITKTPIDDLYDRKKKEIHRHGLIHLSENVIKPILGDDIWAYQTLESFKSLENYSTLIVPDCRYASEMLHFRNNWVYGNVITVLVRSHQQLEGCGFSLESFPWDVTIDNDESLEYLYEEVHEVINSVLKQPYDISKNYLKWNPEQI